MKVRIGLCQLEPVSGEPSRNADKVMERIGSGDADVYVFPEMFLTGYGAACDPLMDEAAACLGTMSDACRELDCAVALGTPRTVDGGIRNSLAFLSPDGDAFYDKAHLARFGIYSEDGFVAGDSPALGSYHGMRFGMCICYDVFFPEILHGCSLDGASVNICVAASAIPSKPFFDRILCARALENVSYLAYVNNTGSVNGLEMHGSSRGIDPFGDTVCECGTGEGMAVFTADTERLDEARTVRRHLQDYRIDVDWHT